MRALYLNQQERYKRRWYKAKNQKPPNLGFDEERIVKKEPCTMTITDTYIVDGFETPAAKSDYTDMSYWETRAPGMEPIDFASARNAMRSDSVVSWTSRPLTPQGPVNKCFTPYENDVMAYGAFEVTMDELRRRGNHLAEEMKRVDDEFNRPPKRNWFCMKGQQFSIEHTRYNELKRRRATRDISKERENKC